jgi:prepilin-type N-terminal cleavage/methylation domain-containing protein
MPMSSTGNKARGVTLMEMMVVMAIISLIVAVSFPSTMAGLDNVRLSTATRSVAAFVNSELSISIPENSVTMRSPDANFVKKLNLPPGITVAAVWPALTEASDEPRRFLLQPGGVPPRIGIEIANKRGARRIVRLDPITGATQIEQPETP